MPQQDWLIQDDGECLSFPSPRQWDLLSATTSYRLHRFLTELDDVINEAEMSQQPETEYLPTLRCLVRKLLLNVYWISQEIPTPSTATGTEVKLLYDEPGYPLTLQTEIMLPGTCTTIHNHGTWGVVATLQGQQNNTFWKPVPTSEYPQNIEKVGEQVFQTGDIISFTTEAIHCVEATGNEPTVTLNLYGDTHASKRFKFDPETHKAYHF
ncbi:unknown [Crocosphaera subtropica ATCC 51142]|uniref:Cupin n=1 Tax=Crocosphaera subtropica (strain ATCC 51142 / BH68) TaxID=43989 RepID=B1WQI4_CROS5|nr:cupin [Crocosphaera subtropica]ACB51695.1 unknown [Crocosphaera subtropica ATCC 51142]